MIGGGVVCCVQIPRVFLGIFSLTTRCFGTLTTSTEEKEMTEDKNQLAVREAAVQDASSKNSEVGGYARYYPNLSPVGEV